MNASDSHVDDRLARRNALVLAVAQAIGGSAAPIVIGTGGLAGDYLLGLAGLPRSYATVPVTMFVLGTAAASIPANLLMKRIGRRAGFMLGAFASGLGSLLACWALVVGSFPVFVLATGLAGAAAAFVQAYRYAAADTASDDFRPRAISWVMAGGVMAGVVGPQTVIWTKDLFSPILFAGAFLGAAMLQVVNLAVLAFVRIPQLPAAVAARAGRPLGEIMRSRTFVVAALCGVASYAMMSLVMTATPLAMVACGLSQTEAALGIQWHVIAMFGPSFFTGTLLTRFGKPAVVAAGMALLAAAGVTALSGLSVAHFWTALVLLGVGWNFGFVGATAMVTDSYRPEERAKVQAANEFLIFATVALASFSSGKLLTLAGWDTINMMIFPVVALCVALLAWFVTAGVRPRAAV
ncbi:MFS transporter [Prosthecomicrobium sp. N25]|uniref:MFS transporter n=1 Tax=Prosthecomicrobium sp. N25 TaxID=3129254 RepID=UPI003077EC9A